MPNLGDIISGKYRILDRLGAGAMGIVFSAVHVDTEKLVALKWLNPAISSVPSSAERFKREAKATGRIHHPNVVAVHDCGEHEGELYMVMEYLAGHTLRHYLAHAAAGRLALEDALGLLFPIMRGIAAAHAVGVLHRDLKPENVLLVESPDGLAPIPKVLDFGLAKVRSEASRVTKLSMPGSVLGTYQYMAPEQLRPNGEVDERIDVYALGAMLYEMLSGGPPYRADNPVDLVLEIHASEPPLLDVHAPELPAELSDVVAHALTRDPATRYPSVEAFAAALEPFAQHHRFRGTGSQPGSATPPPLPVATRPLSATQLIEQRLVPAKARHANVVEKLTRRSRHWLQLGLAAAALFVHPGSMDLGPELVAADNTPTAPLPEVRPAPPPMAAQEDTAESDWAATATDAHESTAVEPASDPPPPSAAATAEPSIPPPTAATSLSPAAKPAPARPYTPKPSTALKPRSRAEPMRADQF